jgi:hypothetical protein
VTTMVLIENPPRRCDYVSRYYCGDSLARITELV